MLPARPHVSVVIPCRDVVDVLDDQLRALAEQDFPESFEVLLCDNGSTDGLSEHVAAWRDEHGLDLRWVDASARPGVSCARNAGLAAARADLVVVCDADDVVSPGWLSAMRTALQSADLVAGAVDVTTLNSRRSLVWRPGPPAGAPPVKLDFLPYARGCNLAVKRDVALAHGGWREDYVAGGDDVEFSWRLQLRGVPLAFAPEAVVKYRYRETLSGMARQMRGYSRSDARLLRDFEDAGLSRLRPSQVRRDVSWLVRNAALLLSGLEDRGRWVCRAASLRGRLTGMVENWRLV